MAKGKGNPKRGQSGNKNLDSAKKRKVIDERNEASKSSQVARSTVTRQQSNKVQNKDLRNLIEGIVVPKGGTKTKVAIERTIQNDVQPGPSNSSVVDTNNNATIRTNNRGVLKALTPVKARNTAMNDGIFVDVEEAETVDDQLIGDTFEEEVSDDGATLEGGNVVGVAQGAQSTAQLRDLFNQFLDDRMKAAGTDERTLMKEMLLERDQAKRKELKGNERNCSEKTIPQKQIKSPSDTTLYRPALKYTTPIRMPINKEILNDELVAIEMEKNELDVIAKISNFVDTMQVQHDEERGRNQNSTEDLNEPQPGPSSVVEVRGLDSATRRSEQAIIEAEKFKAAIVPPQQPGKQLNMVSAAGNDVFGNVQFMGIGNQEQLPDNGTQFMTETVERPNIGTGTSDEDFFHLMCHVDVNLRNKIERGEFVELEKLLPRDRRNSYRGGEGDGSRLVWVQRDGNTFLAPAGDREAKINGIRSWERAFRVYCTIYCSAHPDRSREVWQYIEVINTAAASFIWENVAAYDYNFRHLMAFNPQRSWAVTYNQMWNLCMKEHIAKNYSYNGNNRQVSGGSHGGGQSSHYHQQNNNHQQQQSGRKKGKPDYCWNFNRGVICKYGKNCRFIERCSFCDASSHGLNTCAKAAAKDAALKKEQK